MKTATSLTVMAIGAIFAFAITASPSFLNLQAVGWILILTGAAGMLLGRRSRDWIRRTVIVKGSPDISRAAGSRPRRRPAKQIASTPAPLPDPAPAETTPAETTLPDQQVVRETIEEYMEP